ncbi:hypothetical protein [Mesomycoplasma molare]|uniref:Ribbon-helix-helix protein CopG domain-containing protein n=1 Tax=Mesomycoplasma molare TaxID=171288 RepID=A0ABY5TUZ8_9BACT|nr:hypothetical protein [Mesomycoplasma molare]UWD34489.1 hypothetical protein NX772_01505 [Mesomycoplasma molare]
MIIKDTNFDINSLLKKQNDKLENRDDLKVQEPKKDMDILVDYSLNNFSFKSKKETFGYYLEVDIDRKLTKLARQMGVKKSDILEFILKKYFNEKS